MYPLIMNNMKRRVGKFYLKTKVVNSCIAPKLFKDLGFVPLRVEHLFYNDCFEFIGTSHLFCPIEEGLIPPEYEITFNEDLTTHKLILCVKKL